MHNNISEKTESLFFELAGDLRLSMLLKLSEHKYRLSQLSNELDATMQEAHRNIIRLVESGLVFKDGEGDLGLTSYGKSIVFLSPVY
jgi:predicted transcriptional regulator